MNVTQKEIQDAVMLILQNTEEMTTDALEKLSFAVWVEQQIRIKPQEKMVCEDCACMNPARCNLRGM